MSRLLCVRILAILAMSPLFSACASKVLVPEVVKPDASAPPDINIPDGNVADEVATIVSPPAKTETQSPLDDVQPLSISSTAMTGKLQNSQLSEVSGLVASSRYPGVLYAINDSGNSSVLYAIDETGQSLKQWRINARNRDWEDLARIYLAGKNYIVVGDTGDNLRVHKSSTLHLFDESDLNAKTDTIEPTYSIRFHYEDGSRNVEAFAAIGQTLYLLSKEPVGLAGPSPSGVYQLDLPEQLNPLSTDTTLIARRIGSMPLRSGGLESKLAATLAGVDLSHPTALAFDKAGTTAYILTYREVLRVSRSSMQSWADAFAQPATRLLSHKLAQAEGLCLSEGRAVWFTSENAFAPVWAIPIDPPL